MKIETTVQPNGDLWVRALHANLVDYPRAKAAMTQAQVTELAGYGPLPVAGALENYTPITDSEGTAWPMETIWAFAPVED